MSNPIFTRAAAFATAGLWAAGWCVAVFEFISAAA